MVGLDSPHTGDPLPFTINSSARAAGNGLDKLSPQTRAIPANDGVIRTIHHGSQQGQYRHDFQLLRTISAATRYASCTAIAPARRVDSR